MPKGIGPGDYILDESGRDITPRAKRRLSDYLSTRTRGGAESFTPPEQGGGTYTYMPPRPNAFPVDEGTTEITADASRQSPGSFAPDLRTPITDPDLREVVRVEPSAERSVNGGVTGHEAVNSQRARSAAEGVLSSNRFTARGKFTSKTFSAAVPESPTFTGQGPDTGKNVFESMRKAALVSMLNAAGGVAGPGGGLVNMSSVESAALKNSLPRIGIPNFETGLAEDLRVRTDALRPAADRSRIGGDSSLTFEGSESGDDEAADISPRVAFDQSDVVGASPTKYNGRTYGQLNSYLQSFSGSGTFEAVPLALLAYGALFAASAVVSLVISLFVNRLPRPNPTTDPLPLGSERGPDFGRSLFASGDPTGGAGFSGFLQNIGNLISKILGVLQPYDGDLGIIQYFSAALEGSLAILGIDTNSVSGGAGAASLSLGSNIGAAILNVSLSPGFYLTIVREVARDLALFVDTAQSDAGPIATFQAFRSSKLVRFVDVCARLGIVNGKAREADALSTPDSPAGVNYPAGGDSNSPSGATVNAFETAQRRVSRSKETTGSKRLAWSHTSLGYTRSELVTEGLVKSLGRQRFVSDGGITTGLSSLRNLRSRKIASSTGRISPEDRAYHEQLLDSEYMPFYIHDVRTNEILSFHAFLSQLTDSYSANYTSVDGFGRMDPVQIYKNTTRSIAFTFVIVSTSPDDHSQMWYSVNKLVNMVYPQWSEGDRISVDKNTYTQPFSQTVAASPMVRVRIGDVIHSNYSRFALERIFGLEQPESKLEGNELYKVDGDDKTPDGDYAEIIKTTTSSGVPDPGTSALKVTNSKLANLNEIDGVLTNNEILAILGANIEAQITPPVNVRVKPGRYKFGGIASPGGLGGSGNTVPRKIRAERELLGKIKYYIEREKRFSTKSNVIVEINGGFSHDPLIGDTVTYTFVEVSTDDIEILDSYHIKQPVTPTPQTSNVSTLSLVNDFLDPLKNPVVRSFEQGSGGRGLAGFIQSLGLEYGDTENTWTVERGSRAPNMVRVSVTFLPIHDIPLGLAADGTSRASAYPVGDVTRRRHFPELVQADINMNSALSKK